MVPVGKDVLLYSSRCTVDEAVETIEHAETDYVELTTALVAAYVANNHLQPSEIGALIASTHAALTGLGASGGPTAAPVEKLTPAQIRKSITHEALISFEDGKPYKTLKRHLTALGLSPEAYREKCGLPRDYPMTAASYSEMRSTFAKSFGLGHSNRYTAQKVAEPSGKSKRAGRPRKGKEAAEA